jgi:hypothetical protein
MSETEWSDLRESWDRLKWARKHWQNAIGGATSAKAAADSLGLKENTYSAYERAPGNGDKKHTPLTHQRAIEFGQKFRINWVWILTGQETPFQRTPPQVRAVELMAAAPLEDQERVVDLIEVALRVRGSAA